MAFSETERQKIDDALRPLCDRVPEQIRHQLRNEYVISGHTVTLEEVRPHFQDPARETRSGLARFRYVRTQDEWHLFWRRQTGKWERYDPFPVSGELATLVAEVLRDPHYCFFG